MVARTLEVYPHINYPSAILDRFIKDRFNYINTLPQVEFAKAVKLSSLKKYIFPDCDNKHVAQIYENTSNLVIHVGSTHGDYHLDNFVFDGNNIRLIDWTNYHSIFWADYDILHFYICLLSSREHCKWIDVVKSKQYIELSRTEIILKEYNLEHISCYVLSRCELELAQDVRLSRLDENRIEKYKNMIAMLASLVSSNQE